MDESIIYFNGKIIRSDKRKTVCFKDSGFLYSLGLFETMRSYSGKIFCFKEHIKRIKRSAVLLKINITENERELQAAANNVLQRNKLKNAYVRLTCWKGDKEINTLIFVKSLPKLPQGIYKNGFKALISDFRVNEYSAIAGIKSLNYLNFYLARRFAQIKGYNEAIMLNTKGSVVEGSYSNLFIVKNKILFTPSLDCGCLPGIARGVVLDLAKKLKIKVKETRIALKELISADEVFVTNSLIEVMPVTYIKDKKINKGITGEITGILSKQYRGLVEK